MLLLRRWRRQLAVVDRVYKHKQSSAGGRSTITFACWWPAAALNDVTDRRYRRLVFALFLPVMLVQLG